MNWKKSIHSEVNNIFVSDKTPNLNDNISIKICFLETDDILKVVLRAIINGEETHIPMEYDYTENKLSYYKANLNINQDKINYHFIIKHKEYGYLYYNRKNVYSYIPTEDNDFVIIANYDNPEWVPSSVFYQIFPDRFNNGNPLTDVETGEYEFDGKKTTKMDWKNIPLEYKDGHCLDFFNGDLKGIEDKISHFKELGINAIYINPIFESKTHHRYDCTDYFNVSKHLGGDAALISLVEKLHENNIKIMVDVSINHTGNNHKWFLKALSDKDSIERTYYYFDENNNYRAWYGLHTLPQLNYNSEGLKDIIYRDEDSLVKHYLRQPFNIDGWRFDVGCHTGRADKDQLSNKVWKNVRKEIKKVKKDAYIIGEHWEDNISYLLGDEWDGAMNYFATGIPLRMFSKMVHRRLWQYEGKLGISEPCTGKELDKMITQHYSRIPNQLAFLQFNLIDSHDIFRYHHHEEVFDFDLYKGIISTMFLLPGTPSIYYGDEIGLKGHPYSDEGARYPMEWDKNKWDLNYYELYNKLSKLKTSEDAMHYGNYKTIYADEDTFIYARYNNKTYIISILTNNKDKTIYIPTNIIGLNNKTGADLFNGDEKIVENGILRLDLSKTRNTVLIFK